MPAAFSVRLPDPGRYLSAGLALAVHLLLAAILFYGVTWSSLPVSDAVEVSLYAVRPHPEAPPIPLPPPQPQAQPTETRPPPAPVSTAATPDIPIKAKGAQAAREETKPAPPLADLHAALKRESEQIQQARAAAELEQLQSAARRAAQTEYIDRIRAKIRGNIVLPPNLQGNPEAVFTVTQLPSGDVLDVVLTHTSMNAALDGAIERAIRKSSPLPKPSTGAPERSLRLTFRPLAGD
jgi:colicin import membrane protein